MEQPEIQDSDVAETTAAEESQTEVVEQPQDSDQTDSDSQVDSEEEDEVEIDGRKFALPKSAAEKLKAERLMQADYTRKTQEVAEQRKAIEAQAAAVKQQSEIHQQFVAEIAEVVAIDKQLQQYSAVDWNRLSDEDPVQAMKLDRQMRELQSQRFQLSQTLTQKQQQQALARQQETAKSIQEGLAVLERDIKGWSPEVAKQVVSYAVQNLGAKQETVASITDPGLIKAIHKAQMYDQLVAKQTTKPKPEAQEKPVTRIAAAKSGTSKDPDKMSVKEWTDWRNAQLKRR